MNKKYFTKYLPIENGFKRVVKNAQGIPIDHEQEVKLFLCSKDIQIGDKVQYPNGVVIDNLQIPQEDIDLLKFLPNGPFKVIGEVSKDAVWVTEGMEFDENEIDEASILNAYPLTNIK